MVVIIVGNMPRLHADHLVGILHRVTLRSHRKHAEVVFVIPKGDDLIRTKVKMLLQEGQTVALCTVGIPNQVGIKTGIFND